MALIELILPKNRPAAEGFAREIKRKKSFCQIFLSIQKPITVFNA